MAEDATEHDLAVALKKITKLEASAAAAAAGFAGNRMLTAAIADRLVATVRGNEVSVRVRGDDGRFRSLMTPAEFAAEIVRENAAAFKSTKSDDGGAAGEHGFVGLTAEMLELRRQGTPSLTDADRTRLRASNPWRKETFNLTEQGWITRRDPGLAAELRKAAGVAE